eukprot:jgi/Galph1/2905/GphlegSOOS_G1581.1
MTVDSLYPVSSVTDFTEDRIVDPPRTEEKHPEVTLSIESPRYSLLEEQGTIQTESKGMNAQILKIGPISERKVGIDRVEETVGGESGNESDVSSENAVFFSRPKRRYRASSPVIASPRQENCRQGVRSRGARQRGFTESDKPTSADELPPRLSHTFIMQDPVAEGSSASLRDAGRMGGKIKVGHYRRYQGEVIYKGHHSYDLMQQIKLGIHHSVMKISQVAERNLMMDDFIVEQKTTFSPFGGVDTPPHNTPKFTFKDYFPMVFRDLRQRFGINSELYVRSVCGSEALRELSTPGKSGSLFFHSWDDRFILKTVSKAETTTLKKILPQYYFHMMQNRESLITRFFGLYRITTHKINARRRHIRIVVMNNFLPTRVPIHEKYDLKGSTMGRQASPVELQNPYVTLKDLDFVRNGPLYIDKTLRERLLNQLGYDLLFLSSINIMDYSFLIGLHIPNRESKPCYHQGWNITPRSVGEGSRQEEKMLSVRTERQSFSERIGGWFGENSKGEAVHIFFGIIDILDEYSFRKETEHFLKTRLLCAGNLSVSVCEPSVYAQRLKKFIKEGFVSNEECVNNGSGRNFTSSEQSPATGSRQSPLSSPKSSHRKHSVVSRSVVSQDPYTIREEDNSDNGSLEPTYH